MAGLSSRDVGDQVEEGVKVMTVTISEWRWLLAFVSLLVLVGLVGATVVNGVQAHRLCAPTFDEAAHILPAAQAADDLRRLDFVSFLRHSYYQDAIAQYPFFHSWLMSPFFLLASPSLTVGRVVNVAFVCLSVLLAFFLAGELSPRKDLRWLASWVGAEMVLAVMPLWVYGSRVYLEPAGLLVTLAALFCYVKASPECAGRFWLVCTSLLAAACFFTKYSFGLFVLGGLGLSEALGWLAMRRRPGIRCLCLFAPCVVMLLLWLVNPDKLIGFLAYSRAQDPNMALWSIGSLTYYLRSVSQVYVTTPLVFVLMLLGVGYSVCRMRDHRYCALVSYLLVSFVMVTLVPQKSHRFAYTIAPVALLLGGVGAVCVVERLFGVFRSPGLRYGAAVLLVLLLCLEAGGIIHRFSFLPAAQDMIYACPPANIRPAYRFVLEHTLDRNIKPYILNYWHGFNHYGLVWEYCSEPGVLMEGGLYQLAAAGLAPEPTPENLDRLMLKLREQGVGVLVSIDGSPAGDYTGWQVVEPLWARGDLEWVASSEPFAVIGWSNAYEERVLAGDFRDQQDLDMARREGLEEFSIQLHLYAVVSR
jgi:hypothetical protein